MRDVRDIREFSLADIAEYDRKHFLFERNAFLEPWIRQQNAKGRVLVENGSIRGYGVIRSCRRGYKIGPLFANDERATEDIFLSLVHTTYGEHIYLDVPEVNPRALHLAESYKMQKVFETARMYTAGDPGLPLQNIFGITSFELG
jgi:hypothetical protein